MRTGEWNTTWATVTTSLNLMAGTNVSKFQYGSGDGPSDVDYIVVR